MNRPNAVHELRSQGAAQGAFGVTVGGLVAGLAHNADGVATDCRLDMEAAQGCGKLDQALGKRELQKAIRANGKANAIKSVSPSEAPGKVAPIRGEQA